MKEINLDFCFKRVSDEKEATIPIGAGYRAHYARVEFNSGPLAGFVLTGFGATQEQAIADLRQKMHTAEYGAGTA